MESIITMVRPVKVPLCCRAVLSIPLPLNAWQGRTTPDHIVSLIDELLEYHSEAHVAELLNKRGCITGAGAAFSQESVNWVCKARGLKNHKQRLRSRGLLTRLELARRHGVSCSTISSWHRKGLVSAQKCNEKGEKLYFPIQIIPSSTTLESTEFSRSA